MTPIRSPQALAGFVLLALASAAAWSQTTVTSKGLCNAVGSTHMEALRDREGHNLSVQTISCRLEGGPLNGAVVTGTNTYEWDKAVASGSMVARASAGTFVAVFQDFGVTLTMTEGRVTGWVAKTTGSYRLATGAAAARSGKTFKTVATPNGSGQFVLEISDEP
jgi:hypothetical protein